MKNKKLLTALYIILMLLPLIAVVVAYPFLPDKIPAHYGIDNQVTRWGNKSETFYFSYYYNILWIFYVYCSPKYRRTRKEESGSKKYSTITFISRNFKYHGI